MYNTHALIGVPLLGTCVLIIINIIIKITCLHLPDQGPDPQSYLST